MKIKHLLLSAIAVATALVSCQKDPEKLAASISLSEKSISFDVFDEASQTKTISLVSTRNWSCSFDENWITVSPESGSASNDPQTISITVLKNTGENRTGKIEFRVAGVSDFLEISQAGPIAGDIFSASFATSLVPFVIENKGEYKNVWSFSSKFSCALATAYSNSVNNASESWLVSPEIDLSNVSTAYVSFEHAANFFSSVNVMKDQIGLKISKDNGSTWDDIVLNNYPANASYDFVSTTNNDISKYVGNKVKMAFVYKSTAEKAGTWEIKNLSVHQEKKIVEEPAPEPLPEGVYYYEKFATDKTSEFTIDNKELPDGLTYIWTYAGGNYGMKASAFYQSTNYPSESWLITPEIDLSSVRVAYLTFDHAANKFNNKPVDNFISVKITKDNGANWIDCTIPQYPTGSDWLFVNSGNIDLSAVVGNKIKIAFIYKSTTEAAGTYEVKNIKVSEAGNVPEEEPAAGSVILTFPDENKDNNQVNDYTKTWTAKIGEISWELSAINNYEWKNWTYVKAGIKKAETTPYIKTTTAIPAAISSVSITFDKYSASNVTSAKLTVASDSEFKNDLQSIDIKGEEGVVKTAITKPKANQYYKIDLALSKGSANGFIQISKIVYYAN